MKNKFEEAQKAIKVNLGGAIIPAHGIEAVYQSGEASRVVYIDTEGNRNNCTFGVSANVAKGLISDAVKQMNQLAIEMATQSPEDTSWKPFTPKAKLKHNPKLRR